MSTNIITQGVNAVNVNVYYGVSVEVSMNMDSSIDAQGLIWWLDNGKVLDNYSNSFKLSTSDTKDFEVMLCSESVDTVTITKDGDCEFHPFGLGFAVDQSYGVNIVSSENNGEVYLGEIKEYTLKTVPAITSDIYTEFTASGVLQGRVEQHWSIGGVYFPAIKTKNVLNKRLYTSITNGGSAQMVSDTRPYGDIAEIAIDCSEEQARQIANYLTGTMRGTEKVAVFPLGYNLFGRRYEDLTTCNVKLFSEKFTIKHSSLDSVEISFKLQMTGEVA